MAHKLLSFQIETGISPNTIHYDVIRFITEEEGIKYVATPKQGSEIFEINIGMNSDGTFQPAFNILIGTEGPEYKHICHAITAYFKNILHSSNGWYNPNF